MKYLSLEGKWEAQLAEFRCIGGKLLFSSMEFQNLQQYPEGRVLLYAIYQYMCSDSFNPKEDISTIVIKNEWLINLM